METNREAMRILAEEVELSGPTDPDVHSPNESERPESALGRRVFDVAAVDATARFCGILRMVDAQTRRVGRGEPLSEEAQRIEEEFWRLVDVLDAEVDTSRSNPLVRERVRALLVPWLRKSRFWRRALFKARGPGSDFKLLEWIYELEDDLDSGVAESAVASVLDDVFSQLARVSGVWYRRTWCRDLISSTILRLERPIRILDVGCGDSRYTLDALQLHPGSIRFAGTDEDPSAIAFLRAMLPSTAIDPVGLLCTSLEYLTDLVPTPTLPEAGFDVVLSANLLDDLDDDAAVLLIRHMSNLTRPGGVTAICTSTPDDRFRTIAEWVSDMPIHFRDQSMVLNLFPGNQRALAEATVSPDRTTVCARVVK
jgi:2-polyprenyl-3-methyl-5-hydroxy-6-metoxy-1,4-benzoquinol methylase